VTVEYDPTGSGTGRDNFIAGANIFTGSDRAFNDEELAEDNFAGCVPGTPIVEIPAYISPIAIIFNLEGVESLEPGRATIAGIFKGDITTGTTRDRLPEPGRELPEPPSPPFTARTSRAPPRTSPST
jgi:phosphate transport system substrate-binding protein